MVTLADFNPDGTRPQLTDFQVTQQVPKSILNDATIANAAAHAAVLSPADGVLKAYGQISNELANQEESPSVNTAIQNSYELDQSAYLNTLVQVMNDPASTEEQKSVAVNNYMNMARTAPGSRSLSIQVAQQALLSPSEDENDETVETTIDTASMLDEIDIARGDRQKQINMLMQGKQWWDFALDLAELVVPFSDQTAQAKTSLAMGEGLGGAALAMTLLGESRASLREKLSKMPLEKQQEYAQKLIDVVKAGGGSITPRPNTLIQINQLNSALTSGAYKGGDQFLDNLTSVTDAIFPLAKVVSGLGKAGKGAADLARAANATERMAERAKLETAVQETIESSGAVEKGFDVEESTIAGVKQLVSDKVMDALHGKAGITPGVGPSKWTMDIPAEQIDPVMKQVDELITPSTITKPDALAKKIAEVVHPLLSTAGAKVSKKALVKSLHEKIVDESNINRLMARTLVDHNSLAATFAGVSPSKSRALNQMMEADTTGKVAKATYGTTREEAIASDRGFEVATMDGSVRVKTEMDESAPAPRRDITDRLRAEDGRTELSPAEKNLTRTVVKNDFRDVVGVVPRKAISTVGDFVDTPSGVSIDMVYGPKDGGFAVARQGVNQVLRALSKYGVKEKDIELIELAADGTYRPVGGIPSVRGNYLVRVKYNYEFDPNDVVYQAMHTDGKYRMFESRASLTDGSEGSLLSHAVPWSAILDPVLFNSASVASDSAAKIKNRLLSLANEYAKQYKGLDKKQKALVDAYKIEANNKGLKFNTANLKARGMNPQAIEALRSWKATTDTLWYLENLDYNRTLRGYGWMAYTDRANKTDLIARPVGIKGSPTTIYDSATGEIRKMDMAEMKELYEKKGTLAELRNPVTIGDDTAEFVISREDVNNYMRRIRDEDENLPYRDGYYPIKYKSPIFITKEVKGEGGNVKHVAIATAGSVKDAEAFLERLRATDAAGKYAARPDVKSGSQEFRNFDWDVTVASGRSAQRVRGERLKNASGITDLDHTHVYSPEESLVQSISSIANRTSFRNWVENSKARWMKQFGHLVEGEGFRQWPTSPKLIKGSVEVPNSQIKDAKITWRYINTMENGYANLLDDATKNFLANMADTSGRSKSWRWLESPLRNVAEHSPSRAARLAAFTLLLATNPIRSLMVQASQTLPVLLATNPLAIPKVSMQMLLLDHLASGGEANSFVKGVGRVMNMSPAEAKELAKNWEASGFEAAVDAHTLIREQVNALVDTTAFARVKNAVTSPIRLSQQIGFNLGEKILMRAVWLSEYDILRRAGTKFDAEVLANLNSRVRNLTLNMNKAGEFAYNENTLSSAMQFLQAPHKAFGQILMGHRGLSTKDRWVLGASYIATYGVGAGWLTNAVMSMFNNDPQVRDIVEGGMFNLAMNAALENIFQEDTDLDFSSSFRLLQAPDFARMVDGVLRADFADVISGSPSASLFVGSNPRVTNFIQSILRPFILDDGMSTADEMALIGKNALDLFSGTSNWFKAKYAWEHHKAMTAKGDITDYNVSTVEAWFKLAGIQTNDEGHKFVSEYEAYRKTQTFKDDVKKVVDAASSLLADQGISADRTDYVLKMMSYAQRVFQNDPIAMKEFADQIYYKARRGEYDMYKTLKQIAGYTTPAEFERMVKQSTLPPEYQETLLRIKGIFEKAKQ